jgi:hypothetical protein
MIPEEDADNRSVSSKDQLTYRITIQKIVDRCFFTMGTMSMPRHVKALRMALYFQIPGLPFKNRIDKKEEKLKTEKEKRIKNIRKKQGRSFYGNAEKAKRRIKIQEWYWEKFLEYLLDLLAEHDALMKAREWVETGEMSTEELTKYLQNNVKKSD